ncbi:MAG: response regulator transcription factor [Verrucomicrobiaceae bacterium]
MTGSGGHDATVFLVDDDESVLRALGRLVRSAGWEVEMYQSAREFLGKHSSEKRGCLVLDLTMPEMGGLELQEELEKTGSRIPIIFLSGNGTIPASVKAMKSGAVDFLSKPCGDEVLLGAIEMALEANRKEHSQILEQDAVKSRMETLTPREREVMLGVIRGQMNKEIAFDLGIAEKTIKVHRGRVMVKLGVGSVAELVRLATEVGL